MLSEIYDDVEVTGSSPSVKRAQKLSPRSSKNKPKVSEKSKISDQGKTGRKRPPKSRYFSDAGLLTYDHPIQNQQQNNLGENQNGPIWDVWEIQQRRRNQNSYTISRPDLDNVFLAVSPGPQPKKLIYLEKSEKLRATDEKSIYGEGVLVRPQ